MATNKSGKKGAGKRGPSFPVQMPAAVVDAAQRRAAEIFLVPTYFFQHACRQLIALDIPQDVIDAAIKVQHERAPAGAAAEKKSWNFELPEELREPGHAAARALGFTLSSFFIAMAELLAQAPEPEYMRLPGQFLRERLTTAKRQAKRAGKESKQRKPAAATAEG